MHRPTVSVVIPVYNGKKHIRGTLRSVLEQTLLPDEIILVDDGSTDGSGDLLDKLRGDVPIKVLHQANAGQSAARNAAAAVATGDLLAFLDQDDQWAPEHLTRLTRPFDGRPDIGWTYSDFDEIDGRGRLVARGFLKARKLEHPKESLGDMVRQDLMILPSAAVIRAKAFNAVGGFDPELCGYEDDDLFIRLFRAGWRAEFFDECLTRFRIHTTSSSNDRSFQESRLKFLDKLIKTVPNNQRLNRYYIRDLVFPRLFRATLAEYVVALHAGDFDKARSLADILLQMNERQPAGRRRELELSLLQRPEAFLRFLRVYNQMPKRMRPKINPTLMLRNTRVPILR